MNYQMILISIFILFFIGFVSALNSEIKCPDSVSVNEEFECSVSVSGGEGVYDLKIGIEKDGKTVARIWDFEKGNWKSSYYYLVDFINNGENKKVKLKVEAEGKFDGVLKLRQNKKVESFGFSMEIGKGEVVEKKIVEKKEINKEKNEDNQKEKDKPRSRGVEEEVLKFENSNANEKDVRMIALNSPVEKKEEVLDKGESVYESKNSKILDYAPYAFSVFLIFIIVVLFLERK